MPANWLKIIFTRSIVFYLLCFLLIWRILDYHELRSNAVLQTMSRLTPPVDYFDEFVDRDGNYDRYKLMDCIYYHKAVANFFPFQKAESFGMLGFCYDRLGQENKAISAYTQAIAANPDYFWPYYDLGVIYYDRGQYTKAIDFLHQALELDPVRTFVLLARSKVYNDVKLSQLKGGPYDVGESLKQGHTGAYILLMESLDKTAAYPALLKTALYGLKAGLQPQAVFYYYANLAALYLKQNPEKAALLKEEGAALLQPYLQARVQFF